jgi:isocitrate dehydrogenase
MAGGDFFGNEKSMCFQADDVISIVHEAADGTKTVLKQNIKLLKGEVMDATFMSASALQQFFEAQMSECKEQGILLSLHLKATMMKVSDPIMFGHCVKVFFKAAVRELAESHLPLVC